MVSSVSVTLAMALTTTTGFCGRRPLTIAATRSMARAASTEVPPNFKTIIGVTRWGETGRGADWEPGRGAGRGPAPPPPGLRRGHPTGAAAPFAPPAHRRD